MRATIQTLADIQDLPRALRMSEEKGFRRGYFEGYQEALEDSDDFCEIELTQFMGKLAEWKSQEPSALVPPPNMTKAMAEYVNNSPAVEAVNKIIESLKGPT